MPGAKSLEVGRLLLANAVLAVASEDRRDVDALKREALRHMAFNYSGRLTEGIDQVNETSAPQKPAGRNPI
jgi:hypothetical protein